MAYNLSTRDIVRMKESFSGENPARIIYHSHIDVGSYFSHADEVVAQRATPAYPVEYLVVDAQAHEMRGAKQFGWDHVQQRHVEVTRYP